MNDTHDIKSFDNFIPNKNFKILTEDGYKKFDGITRTRLDVPPLELTINNNKKIVCTINHKFYISKNEWVYAKHLSIGTRLYSPYNTSIITDIKESDEKYVYDIINVDDTNTYLVDDLKIKTSNCLYLDEFAFVDNDNEFYNSVYPTISSGKNTKVIITSTPNGLNLFYRIFTEAEQGVNNYKSYKILWFENPERNQKWHDETLSNVGEATFAVEYECKFMGSSGTLITGKKLESLASIKPIKSTQRDDVTIFFYDKPQKDHIYVACVDTGEGVGGNYSVINIIDITTAPYKQVFIYRDNTTPPIAFSSIVAESAKKYNDALIVIENNNSSGAIVAHELWYNIEYENILTSKVEQGDTEIGFSSKTTPGIRTTKRTKSTGCLYLKNLIESDQLIVRDHETIFELSTFIRVGNSYEAEKGKNDDIAMTLVIFSWFSSQDFFEDETGINTNKQLSDEFYDDSDNEFVLGFINDGMDDYQKDDLFDEGLLR